VTAETDRGLSGRSIVLGVTGSIAAFKAVALASELTKRGAVVDVIMTEGAKHFVDPLSFQAITHRPVHSEMFSLLSEVEIGHISLGQRADVFVIAPASANEIARLALGLADNLLLTTALATRAPILIAPAMEPLMYSHPATEQHVATLKARGAIVLEPKEGRLASGRVGRGRMVEPPDIVSAIETALGRRQDMVGQRVLVTAGPNHEPIDPVRFIGNRSSGKMGYAIAEAARERGAEVVLVSGPTNLPVPTGVRIVRVETARDMQAAVNEAAKISDIIVMAAAVADYRVADVAEHKMKREHQEELHLRLVRNPDILAGLADLPTFKVGFAAETDAVLENARSKLARKGAQMIVGNDVTAAGSGFGTDTNQVVIVDWTGASEALPLLSKREVADRILDRALKLIPMHRAALEQKES
jgi:phosphopantothenoylcysteine decarboxylase / phosphopantothenate---cysteine ligase